MIVTLTAKDIMQIFIFVGAGFLFIHWVWPWILKELIQRRHRVEKYSGWLLAIAMGYAVVMATVLIFLDDKYSWWDTEPAVTATVLTAGVLFAYSKAFPTKFFAAFQEVDLQTDSWHTERKLELTVPKNSKWPIFLVVHNTGISSWNHCRVTVEFDDAFLPMVNDLTVPESYDWDWATAGMKIGENPPWIQIQRDGPLTVGEPQTFRFLLQIPSKQGRYRMGVKVVSDIRIGESEQPLWVNVVDTMPATRLEPYSTAS